MLEQKSGKKIEKSVEVEKTLMRLSEMKYASFKTYFQYGLDMMETRRESLCPWLKIKSVVGTFLYPLRQMFIA